jgi:hypothetical protein
MKEGRKEGRKTDFLMEEEVPLKREVQRVVIEKTLVVSAKVGKYFKIFERML